MHWHDKVGRTYTTNSPVVLDRSIDRDGELPTSTTTGPSTSSCPSGGGDGCALQCGSEERGGSWLYEYLTTNRRRRKRCSCRTTLSPTVPRRLHLCS